MQTKSDLSDGAGGRSAVARARLSTEMHGLLDEVDGLVRETASLTADELARAKDRIGERLTAAKQSAQEMGDKLVKRARRGAEATNTYVHERPWKAVGIGAAVAFLLGFVLSRR
jgi:ElaB/YqjD/DUF883 family membrane-anchored ribosome-binding protein